MVPILNARYALNAANARWGSLYDALYGTDVIPEDGGADKGPRLQPGARRQGDRLRAPVPGPGRAAGERLARRRHRLQRRRRQARRDAEGRQQSTGLKDPAKFVGYQGEPSAPSSVLLKNNGLHLDIHHRPQARRSARPMRPASADVVVEAALSTILDLEDSVAAVDAEDKVLAYRNWLGILQGTLTEQVHKGGKSFTRGLNPDRVYHGARRATAK